MRGKEEEREEGSGEGRRERGRHAVGTTERKTEGRIEVAMKRDPMGRDEGRNERRLLLHSRRPRKRYSIRRVHREHRRKTCDGSWRSGGRVGAVAVPADVTAESGRGRVALFEVGVEVEGGVGLSQSGQSSVSAKVRKGKMEEGPTLGGLFFPLLLSRSFTGAAGGN
jgi:hypothetical protein